MVGRKIKNTKLIIDVIIAVGGYMNKRSLLTDLLDVLQAKWTEGLDEYPFGKG